MGFTMVHNNHPYWAPSSGHYRAWDQFLGRAGSGWGRSNFFDFLKFLFHVLLNRASLIIVGSKTNFWVGQEVGGAGQDVFGPRTIP